MGEIDDFLNSLGKDREPTPEEEWFKIIPDYPRVVAILGWRGAGKSALAYRLAELLSESYERTPAVVNLPLEKAYLIPKFPQIQLQDLRYARDAVCVIDEGTTMLPTGAKKLADMTKGLTAQSRHRNQIIIFVYHNSRDIDARIFENIDTVVMKNPHIRQIQFGAKDNFLRSQLKIAKLKLKTVKELGEDPRRYTYIVPEEDIEIDEDTDLDKVKIEGRLIPNELPSFWSDELSCAWASGTEEPAISKPEVKERKGYKVDGKGNVIYDEGGKYFVVTRAMEARRTLVELSEYNKSSCATWEDPLTGIRWIDFRRSITPP